MKVLVTGGSGFTGVHFCRLLEGHGYQIFSLQSDLLDYVKLELEVQSLCPDFVVHLAAISYVGHERDSDFYDVNTIGTMNLLRSLAGCKAVPKRILIASSATVYGNTADSPIGENQPVAPVTHYAASKLSMEHLANVFLRSLPIFFVRPFNYTGIGQSKTFLIPKLVNAFNTRAPTLELGNTKIEREFNDVRNVCSAYLALLEKSVVGEVYNVCSGRSYTLDRVLQVLEELTQHRPLVTLNKQLVRSNEVARICGDPKKLNECIGEKFDIELRTTLMWMLT